MRSNKRMSSISKILFNVNTYRGLIGRTKERLTQPFNLIGLTTHVNDARKHSYLVAYTINTKYRQKLIRLHLSRDM